MKRHPSYEHQSGVREVEAVPEELAGSLNRGEENIVVISRSKAEARAERYARIHAEVEKLFEDKANTTNGQGSSAPAAPVV